MLILKFMKWMFLPFFLKIKITSTLWKSSFYYNNILMFIETLKMKGNKKNSYNKSQWSLKQNKTVVKEMQLQYFEATIKKF